MQIVIEIDKDQYEMVKQYSGSYDFGYAIAHGTVLPENHGELKDISDFDVIALQGKSGEFVDGVKWILEQIDNAPAILEASESEG